MPDRRPTETTNLDIYGDAPLPSAGPSPWDFYRFTFRTVFGVATKEPNGASRWRFG